MRVTLGWVEEKARAPLFRVQFLRMVRQQSMTKHRKVPSSRRLGAKLWKSTLQPRSHAAISSLHHHPHLCSFARSLARTLLWIQ